jgi:phosphatidylserine decarboxylase
VRGDEGGAERTEAAGERLTYWDRAAGRFADEAIYGGRALRWLYGSRLGFFLARTVLARRAVSRAAGWYYSRSASRRRIAPFVERFRIDLDEFEPAAYRSFNEFFTRRFRAGRRPFASPPDVLPAFAEGRYLVFDSVSAADALPVKGAHLAPEAILGGRPEAKRFEGGPVAIARLCPLDYHRFHYPDRGRTVASYRIPGSLHSVNPFALRAKRDIFATNERHVAILETESFGALAYVEVGALNVGRIVQTHDARVPFARGDEKGYFLFGGSTVIVFATPGALRFDEDLVERSRAGVEVLVRLGRRIAAAAR